MVGSAILSKPHGATHRVDGFGRSARDGYPPPPASRRLATSTNYGASKRKRATVLSTSEASAEAALLAQLNGHPLFGTNTSSWAIAGDGWQYAPGDCSRPVRHAPCFGLRSTAPWPLSHPHPGAAARKRKRNLLESSFDLLAPVHGVAVAHGLTYAFDASSRHFCGIAQGCMQSDAADQTHFRQRRWARPTLPMPRTKQIEASRAGSMRATLIARRRRGARLSWTAAPVAMRAELGRCNYAAQTPLERCSNGRAASWLRSGAPQTCAFGGDTSNAGAPQRAETQEE